MNQEVIQKIKNDDVVLLRQELTYLEEELVEINSEIPELKAALEGRSTNPEAYVDYPKTKQLLDERLALRFELQMRIAKKKEEVDSASRKWATSIAKEFPKRILSTIVKAVDHLDSISKVLVGKEDVGAGPSILVRYLRLRDLSRESTGLSLELGLAHEVLGSKSVSTPRVPSIPAWEKFFSIINRNPVSWPSWLGDDRWTSNVVSSDERKRIEDAARELPDRIDPDRRLREQGWAEFCAEMDRKKKETAAMSLQERAEKGLLTGADILSLSRRQMVEEHGS